MPHQRHRYNEGADPMKWETIHDNESTKIQGGSEKRLRIGKPRFRNLTHIAGDPPPSSPVKVQKAHFTSTMRADRVVLMRLSYCLVYLVSACCCAQETWHVQRIVGLTKYPMLARMALVQGKVELRCSISDDGTVQDCRGISGNPLLSSAAIENAKSWRFRRSPETTVHSSQVTLDYSFELIGEAVRGDPKMEFVFELPNHVRFASQPQCADHAPCTPEEQAQWQRDAKKRRPEK